MAESVGLKEIRGRASHPNPGSNIVGRIVPDLGADHLIGCQLPLPSRGAPLAFKVREELLAGDPYFKAAPVQTLVAASDDRPTQRGPGVGYLTMPPEIHDATGGAVAVAFGSDAIYSLHQSVDPDGCSLNGSHL